MKAYIPSYSSQAHFTCTDEIKLNSTYVHWHQSKQTNDLLSSNSLKYWVDLHCFSLIFSGNMQHIYLHILLGNRVYLESGQGFCLGWQISVDTLDKFRIEYRNAAYYAISLYGKEARVSCWYNLRQNESKLWLQQTDYQGVQPDSAQDWTWVFQCTFLKRCNCFCTNLRAKQLFEICLLFLCTYSIYKPLSS